MQRMSTHQRHHRGVCAGLFLAIGVAGVGFLLQAELVRALHGSILSLLIGASLVIASFLAVVCLRHRH
jgi:drug/metabolite transporter (DMT)-like permease